MSAEIHQCPVQGCSWQVRNDLLMCAGHWKMLPAYLVKDVNRYWRQTSCGDNQKRLLAIHNYRVARDAAIAYVNNLITPLSKIA